MWTIQFASPRGIVERAFRSWGLADGPQWLVDQWGGTRTLAGERISVEGSLAIADVFSAVSLVCEQVATLPVKVYRDLSLSPTNTGEGIVETPEYRAAPMLSHRPNPYTPAKRFWATVAAHQMLWGNWYLEMLRGQDGLVNELRLLDPSMTEVQFSDLLGAKRFIVTRTDGRREVFGSDRVLHGFGFSRDGLVGLSPIQQARETLGVIKARERYQADVYQRPSISGVIQHPKAIKGQDGPKRLRENWRAIYGSGSKDRHNVAVLEEGASFQQVTAPLADMQFVESSQLSKTEIASIFHIPPAYLGGSTGDSLTYSTVEQNRIQLAAQAVGPVVANIAEFVSQDVSIFPFPSWFCSFVLEAMMRGEPNARASYWKTMKEVVGLDPRYIAQVENIPFSALKKPEPVPPQLAPPDPPSEPSGILSGNGRAAG